MKKKTLSLSKVYTLLEPGPVVMVTTSAHDKNNIMTMSWHMMIDFEPPMFGCVISNRNYSFKLLQATKECVINIPTVALIKQVVGVGNTTGSKVDKFTTFNLTPEPASKVNVPMIGECYANLECKVVDVTMAEKYNIFIMQVVKAWITPSKKRQRMIHHAGSGVFIVDGTVMKLPSKKK